MALPTQLLLRAAGLWLALAVAVVVWPALLPVWAAGGLLLTLVAAGDALYSSRLGVPLAVRREARHTWPVGVTQTIGVRLRAERVVSGEIFDRPPAAFAEQARPLPFRLAAGEWLRLEYGLKPTERGRHEFGQVDLRLKSRFGLWWLQFVVDEAETVRVYPDFAKLTEYALLETDNRLSQLGVLRQQRRGEGLEFHQLREYRQDDPVRRIDWKATARRRRPIVREYQDERDQSLFFMLDCSQRMRSRDGELSHFDHTLNAMLLLAYVALRQGDAVGFATFAHHEARFLAPRKSLETIPRILEMTYDLQPTERIPDYQTASQALLARLRKRSLVVWLTNLRDEDSANLELALGLLRPRHLTLVASLREAVLDELVSQPIKDFDDALTYAAALDYRAGRRRQLATLSARGAALVDAAPAGLPTALVNRYWSLKRSGAF